jgi:uncharacterized membrane protein
LTTSFAHTNGWFPRSVFGPGIAGKVVAFGAVAAGAAIFEAALIPGLLIGGAAVLAPRLVPHGTLSRLKLRQAAPSPAAPAARSASPPASGEPAAFDTWRAIVKTFTYRAIVTTVDFGANYVVIGEPITAAGLSSLSLVAGPIAYFAHEAGWHYYGPAVTQNTNASEGQVRFAGITVSRALGKTITYEGVTAVSEFGANYLFVRDLVAAAGLTAFSVAIAPIVYYVHERAWDYYDATKSQPPVAPMPKLLPAA